MRLNPGSYGVLSQTNNSSAGMGGGGNEDFSPLYCFNRPPTQYAWSVRSWHTTLCYLNICIVMRIQRMFLRIVVSEKSLMHNGLKQVGFSKDWRNRGDSYTIYVRCSFVIFFIFRMSRHLMKICLSGKWV